MTSSAFQKSVAEFMTAHWRRSCNKRWRSTGIALPRREMLAPEANLLPRYANKMMARRKRKA